MFNVLSILIGLFALLCAIPALIPYLGALNWVVIPIAVIGLAVGVLSSRNTGRNLNLVVLVVAAFLAGAGTEVFGMGWNLAMQENIEDRLLSRAYSYDALGSFVAMPVGQLAYGTLAETFGFRPVLVASAVVYVAVVGLVLCSRSVRTLPRSAPTPTPDVTSTTP